MERRTVLIIGATGSIGMQSVDVLKRLSGFELVGFTYHSNLDLAVKIKSEFPSAKMLSTKTELEKFEEFVSDLKPDIVIAAAPGFAGFELAYRAIPYTRRLALANKESLVCGGKFLKERLEDNKTELIPIDSEHSAIFQLMEKGVEKIAITASGGALRDWPIEHLKHAKPSDVLKHPVWSMGKKITVDSATMFNKALEVMEAMELFDLPFEKIDVYVHREGVVHGMVFLKDGTVKVHTSVADMRIPIALSLTYPERSYEFPKFPEFSSLSFEKLSRERYPIFFLVESVKDSYSLRTAFNAADEVAVQAFLEEKIGFTDIPKVVERVLREIDGKEAESVEDLKAVDRESRRLACEITRSC